MEAACVIPEDARRRVVPFFPDAHDAPWNREADARLHGAMSKPDPSDSTRPHRPNPYAGAALFPLGVIAFGACVYLAFKALGG